MDLLLSLVSVLLVAGGGGGTKQHVSFADAATTAATNSETARSYWQAVLPGIPMPPAITHLLASQNEHASLEDRNIRGLASSQIAGFDNLKFVKGLRKIGPNYGRVSSDVDQEGLKEVSVSDGSEGAEDLNKGTIVNMSQLPKYFLKLSTHPQVEENLQKILVLYGPADNKNVKEVSLSYGEDVKEALKEVSMSYGAHNEEDVKEISLSYGEDVKEALKEIPVSHGANNQEDVKEVSLSYGEDVKETLKKISVPHGANNQEDVKEISLSYGEDVKEALREISVSHDANNEEDVKEISVSYGKDVKEALKKISVPYGAHNKQDAKEVTLSYGEKVKKALKKISVSYDAHNKENIKEVSVSYGFEHEVDPKKDSIGHGSHNEGEGHRYHVHANSHKNQRLADVFFFHDMLRPGSKITPTIPPTTSLPTLLPRNVAEAIPFSVNHLHDIMAMFAPASAAMAREIRWTLDTCEHRRRSLLRGERAGCATSLESLADLAASLLETRDVRAFSAGGLPIEAPGTPALRGRHTVTSVRTLAAPGSSSEDVVTCHDLTYPYAVFYCHTSSPTAAYAVTLQASDEEAAPAMEALAVCHLDTSRWSPEHPFFVAHGVRPGDVTVCHFLSKLSIVWVRAGGDHQGDISA